MNVEIIKEKIAARTQLGLSADRYGTYLRDRVRRAARMVADAKRHCLIADGSERLAVCHEQFQKRYAEYQEAFDLAVRHGAVIKMRDGSTQGVGVPSRELDPQIDRQYF